MRRSARVAAFLVAGVIALSFAYDLMRMPVQVGDALGEILAAQQTPSVSSAFWGSAGTSGYLRPLRIAQIKGLFDLAAGEHYWLVYRGFHALLLLAAVWLFTRALGVQDWRDWAAAVFALTVLTGLHTFRGTVRESFPINHFLEIAVFCLVALNLARSRGGWWADVGAVVTFVFASLTLESGLLVWVVVVAAWLSGMRGISRRGLAGITVMLAAYLAIRFVYLSTGTPGLEERSAGFGFGVLESDQLQARFADNPLPFYVYNVLASIMSVLFAEPQSGVFWLTRAVTTGDSVPPRLWLPVVSSIATTALIAWAGIRIIRRRHTMEEPDRLLVVFAAVLLANAALSYAYTKDEIISVAGVFYALAAYAAARLAIEHVPASALRRVALCAVVAAIATGWVVRSAGAHHVLRTQAFKHKNDWARMPQAQLRDEGSPEERRAAALVRQLQRDAIAMRVTNPFLLPRWEDRWWSE